MDIAQKIVAAAVVATTYAIPAMAQDRDFQLPDQCTSMGCMDHLAMGDGGMETGMMDMMGMGDIDIEAMPEHVQQNTRRMMITMPAMHKGMMNEEPDVAFACGMIAHHQGAIDMAEVLLEYGEDPEMQALAEEIIAAQVAEIDRMTTWLSENAN